LRLWEAAMGDQSPPRRRVPAPPPAPTDEASYLAQAEACLAQAATAPDGAARALHEEECTLWLMLARQRKAIEEVVETYTSDTDDEVD
jgi:hypothetical protein